MNVLRIFLLLLFSGGSAATRDGLTGRPPEQTTMQKSVRDRRVFYSQGDSESAKKYLLDQLSSHAFRSEIAHLPSSISNASSATLLKMMEYEVTHAPIIHNVCIRYVVGAYDAFITGMEKRKEENGKKLGADVYQVMEMGYLPTVWTELALSLLPYKSKYSNLDLCERNLLGYPSISIPKPSLQQADDRPSYTSVNVWKSAGGNFEFGEVALWLDPNNVDTKLFISPMDTGFYCCGCHHECQVLDSSVRRSSYSSLGMRSDSTTSSNSSAEPRDPIVTQDNCRAWDAKEWGSTKDFMHLFKPHLNFWNRTLAGFFKRWYDMKNNPIDAHFMYFEGDLSGSALMPESLFAVIVKFSIFGSADAYKVQQWAVHLKRPLSWAPDQNAASVVLDPLVGGIDGNYTITTNDKSIFTELWHQTHASWATFAAKVTSDLHVHFLDYLADHHCHLCPKCRILGVSSTGVCIFWKGA